VRPKLDDRIVVAPPKLSLGQSEDSHIHGGTILLSTPPQAASFFSLMSFTTAMNAHDTITEDHASAPAEGGLRELPFPPVTKQHILNCSYHNWHPK
jgi:hypothetical protein